MARAAIGRASTAMRFKDSVVIGVLHVFVQALLFKRCFGGRGLLCAPNKPKARLTSSA
jgi:hypothetical protein